MKNQYYVYNNGKVRWGHNLRCNGSFGKPIEKWIAEIWKRLGYVS